MTNIVLSPIPLNELEVLIQNSVRKVLSENPVTEPNVPAGDQYLNITQAAELLDLKISSVYGIVHEKGIPYHKRGKRLYFSKQELMDWIKSGRKQTLQEIDQDAEDFIKNLPKKKGGAL